MTNSPDTASPHRVLHLHERVLDRNREQASRNRGLFRDRGVVVINVLSAPGSGKTALLERTLTDLKNDLRAAVIVGDLATDNDAQRLCRSGAPIVQITTGTLCHLEAAMIDRACQELDLAALDLLFIENVGNLVCPATFDLGESLRVVLTAVTEGEDKPLKYSLMFRAADLVLINKADLLAHLDFDLSLFLRRIDAVNPGVPRILTSARTGVGIDQWCDWLQSRHDSLAPKRCR